MKKLLHTSFLLLAALICRGEISGLTAVYRRGQVFLQWQEKNLPASARLTVWGSDRPITENNVRQAVLLADMLNTGSAEDWWLDASNFLVKKNKKMRADEPFANNAAEKENKTRQKQGFVISDKGKPISPAGGLHVHTPRKNETGRRYFAVTAQIGKKMCGFTTLAQPVLVGSGYNAPIVISGPDLGKNSCQGLPLLLVLHGRGGGCGVDSKGRALGTHIIYSSRDYAWREGIPFKFSLRKSKDAVTMTLYDRVWIGRIMDKKEISDGRDRVKAISTFWFGYNPNIAHSIKGPKFTVDNFTERYILHLIDWAQKYLGTDPAATYITGGSMGGSGGIQLATRYPEKFAAVASLVPAYSYTWAQTVKNKDGKPKGPAGYTMTRLICSIGKFTEQNPAVLADGRPLLPFVDGSRNIARPDVDMPPIFATNGRMDYSIHWINCPPFFRAANAARQAFSVYWNKGGHAMSGSSPRDMKVQRDFRGLLRYRLDKSFPAFSNCSDNKKYGSGDPDDGDATGWINRGFQWKVIADTSSRYEIHISADHPDITYPVTTDITLRRRQQFKFPAGTVLNVQINGRKSTVKIDSHHLLTLEKVVFKNNKPVRLIITR